MPSMRSIGSSVLPLDLDIFCPLESRTRPCTYTVLNGIFPVKWVVIITIRATQKKIISKPVTSTEVGRKCFMSGVSSGQPMVEKGTNADENHVSCLTRGSLTRTTCQARHHHALMRPCSQPLLLWLWLRLHCEPQRFRHCRHTMPESDVPTTTGVKYTSLGCC